jgi:SAM-dependent methyltransferase
MNGAGPNAAPPKGDVAMIDAWKIMKPAANLTAKPAAVGEYSLATGRAAAGRLACLHRIYGPGTRELLALAGLRPGMRVADLGCGVGTVTELLAEIVGPEGHVVGVDLSAEQLDEARRRVESAGLTNTAFVRASASQTGLPRGSFDLVYCRFLLLHMPDPEDALREMRGLLKDGGVLVCEDGDLTSAGSEPASALDAFADLFARLGPTRGLDYTLGRRLYHLVGEAGFASASVRFNQPVVTRGDDKRLLEWSVAEAAGAFVDASLISADELERTIAEMERLVEDESVLAIMPRMSQVWAAKPPETGGDLAPGLPVWDGY